MLSRLVISVVLAVMLAGVAAAGSFEDGKAAYQRGDYEVAIRFWRVAGEQGDVKAQSILGVMYSTGDVVPQNYVEAAKWFRLSAEQGHASSRFLLGRMFALGEPRPRG